MKMGFTYLTILSAALLSVATTAFAGKYPDRPVKIEVGYPAGGGPDLIARMLSIQLTKILGQSFFVENKAGAGGIIATELVAKAPPDGYTLLLGETGQLEIAPYLYKKLHYDASKDLTAITRITTGGSTVLVSDAKRTDIKTVPDLIREAKEHPGKLMYGSSGIGSIHHIAMAVFDSDAGVNMIHIPYKGSGESLPALLGGQVQVIVSSLQAVRPYVANGTVNLLAMTGGKRFSAAPDTPSISEFLKGYDYTSETGLLAPPGLPKDILETLSKATKQALNSPDFKEKFKDIAEVEWSTPEEYSKNILENLSKFSRATKIADIKPE